jgi:lipopolysaccharide export system protein LptA
MNKFGIIICTFALLFQQAFAQKVASQKQPLKNTATNNLSAVNSIPPVKDSSSKLIEFLSAQTYNVKKMDSVDYLILTGHVKIRQGKTLLDGDSIVLNTTLNILEGYGNVHINDADSVHTYAQYLKYDGNTKKANLRKKVKLTDGKGVLTTDSLDYDVSVKIGNFKKGGKLVRNKTVLTSTEGFYYGVTRDVIFRKKVQLIDPESKIWTDTLEYNTYSQLANFISPTKIISGSRMIRTRNGNYNTGTRKGYLYERSSIDDSTYTFIADEMAIDDSLGLGEFRGDAVYKSKDTLGFDLMANNIKTNKFKSTLLATELPTLLIKQKKDTLYITADTLYSGKISDLNRPLTKARDSVGVIKDTTLNKYFEAFHHVKIYSDSLQAKCDSLFYALSDSTIRLLTNPIIWASGNQITGDTVFLYIKDKKPEQLLVFDNAFAINQIDTSNYFNQLKGTKLNAWFIDGELSKMRTKGNAENNYFALDNDKKFIGLNHSSAQIIEITFKNSEASKVLFINSLAGKWTPIRQATKDELFIHGFKWQDALRPKSKFDILSPSISKP